LWEALEVHATLFIGDDVTDEDGFAVLGSGDLGIKVGEGATKAAHRVADPHEVIRVLWNLHERLASR
jgi:trehalose-phosphatase